MRRTGAHDDGQSDGHIEPHQRATHWDEAGLKPHLVKGFKVSNDPDFEAKVTERSWGST